MIKHLPSMKWLSLVLLPFFVSAQHHFINNEVSWMFDQEFSKSDTSFNSIKSSINNPFIFSKINEDTIKTKSFFFNWGFNKNFISYGNEEYKIVINPIYDFTNGNGKYYSAARGAFLTGEIGEKFKWYSLYYENLRQFTGEVESEVIRKAIAPGESEAKFVDNGIDYSVANGGMEYRFNKFFSLSLGHGKNFIGNGYRSLLLSDAANSYPFLKTDITIGRVKYSLIVAEFTDFKNDMPFDALKRKKNGSFHFLEVLITKNLRVGLFESVIWAGDSTARSTIDINYLNPFVVFRPVEFNLGSPDNMLLGINGSWDITHFMKLYGQGIIDEFHSKNLLKNPTWWGNKYGYQVGLKLHDFKKAPNLVVVLEHNSVRPFTYSQKESATNYGHNYEALAHPYGANFREYLGIVNYRYKRWNFNLKVNVINGGAESIDSISNGTDIFKSYLDRAGNEGYKIGYGEKYIQTIVDTKLSYILNYNYLLNLQLGFQNRSFNLSDNEWDEQLFYIGLKTSLFNSYYDY
jgi:hypothetical protein